MHLSISRPTLPVPAQPPQPWEVMAQVGGNGVGVGGQNAPYLQVT